MASIVINLMLSFLASTIKNPASVKKFLSYFVVIRDGLNALIASLGGGLPGISAAALTASPTASDTNTKQKILKKIFAAQRRLADEDDDEDE